VVSVKTSGGISTLGKALAMLEAEADRLGTSSAELRALLGD
jgi:deoxyribose-phosphate aldolase